MGCFAFFPFQRPGCSPGTIRGGDAGRNGHPIGSSSAGVYDEDENGFGHLQRTVHQYRFRLQ